MIRPFLLFLGCAALAAGPLGCKKAPEADAASEGAKPPAEFSVERNTNGEPVVNLSEATQQRIALKVAPLAAADLPAQTAAYGSILDPAPLVSQQGDLAAAEAAMEIASTNAQRARTLFAEGENVSRKTLQAAENDERGASIKLAGALAAVRLQWGTAIAALSDADRQQWIDSLVAGKTALARVELPVGETLANLPATARLSPVTPERWIDATVLSAAPAIDPKTLGQAFLLRVDNPDSALAPGAAVQATLPLPAPPQHGAFIPDAAVLRFEGKTWVYVDSGANKFTRREVTLDAPLPDGWFSAGPLDPGEKIVVQAAALLLSEEQKPQFQGQAD